MKKTLIHAVAFTLASAVLIAPGYASSKTDESRFLDVDGNVLFSPTRWRLVKHTFVLHLPQESKPVTQIIIAAPSTVAVSNDIDVLEHNGREINFSVSVNGKAIILAFPEPIAPGTKLGINLNKVKQPIGGPTSVYRFSAKAVGSDAEISVGVARFRTD
ncbi:MAG: DUF2808 domain-containing protein (plasmid) [Phormidium sp.]